MSLLDLMFVKACEQGDTEQAKKLFSDGADINARNKEETTAFCAAIHSGNIELMEFLCENGASIYPLTDDDVPPMMWASWAGRKDIIHLIYTHDQKQMRLYDKSILSEQTFDQKLKSIARRFSPWGFFGK